MPHSLNRKLILTMLAAGLFVVNPAFADKPEGKGKPEKIQEVPTNKQHTQTQSKQSAQGKQNVQNKQHVQAKPGTQDTQVSTKHLQTSDSRITVYFGDHHRDVIRQYYSDSYHSGHCPPGLAKKNNGCQPPGQAKKWRYGHPLPSDVIYYDLPPQVVISLGIPPEGQKYVRVASDILLIAVGTGLVLDAIQDLNNL